MTKSTTLQLKEKGFEYTEHYIVLSAFYGPDAVLYIGDSTKEEQEMAFVLE